MEWTTILVAIIGALTGGGLTSLFTIVETKKHKKLENKELELNLEDKRKDEIIKDWKELAEQRERNLNRDKDEFEKLQAKIDERDDNILGLKNQIIELSTELVKARLLKCSKLRCLDRQPPLGFDEVVIEK